jgi:hypothetical protein
MTRLAHVIDRVTAYADSLDHRPVWELTPHGREARQLASRRGMDLRVVPDVVRAQMAPGERHGWSARLIEPDSGKPLAVGVGSTQLQAVDDLLRSPTWRLGVPASPTRTAP